MATDGRQREGEGWDHVAWRVERDDGSWIVKVVKDERPDLAARSTAREAAVMSFVRERVGSPWAASGASSAGPELTYRRVDGVPLLELVAAGALTDADIGRLAEQLGRFMGALAASEARTEIADLPVDDGGWDDWYSDELDGWLATVAPFLTPELVDAARAFVATPPPPPGEMLVFAHNDLGAEHVMIDPADGTVTGVIDWTDAAIADPAADAGRLLRDLGPLVLEPVIDGLAVDRTEREQFAARAWTYARLLIIEDLADAIGHRPHLVPAEQTAFARLFAGSG